MTKDSEFVLMNFVTEPLNILDFYRKSYNSKKSRNERFEIGQFLTPVSIAQFMASLFIPGIEKVRILDPGAGAGVLFATTVETLVLQKNRPLSIEVVAYENDALILPYLEETMKRCELLCNTKNISFHGIIKNEDFMTSSLDEIEESLFVIPGERFTHIVLNPPYKKINGEVEVRSRLYKAGIEVSNLYAIFAWLCMKLLKPGGQMVAITPRSFCNGPYFKKFRLAFLKMMSLRHIHIFESRKKAFSDDEVLQENIIYHSIRETEKPKNVTISTSECDDFENLNRLCMPYNQIIRPKDCDSFIHIGKYDTSHSATKIIEYFSSNLTKLNINVSTGRTVDFRAKEFLRQSPYKGTVPLIYPWHFQGGIINWPLSSEKKPNSIMKTPETADLLLESGYYVLAKRFSSKEQQKRVMAAVFDPSVINVSHVSFENHLNYFHRRGKGLPSELAKGLTIYLNSTIVDQYFRLFSGHTQVNATDLRKLPYPTQEQLVRFGSYFDDKIPDQTAIDSIIEKEIENCE